MSTRLQGALERVAALRGGQDPSALVERAELGRDGKLYLMCVGETAPLWYADDLRSARVVTAAEDEALPLCTKLRGDATASRARVLAWRPGRRVVLSQGGGDEAIVSKGFRPGRVQRAVGMHRFVAQQDTRGKGLRIPTLLAWQEDTASIVMELLPGKPLDLGLESVSSLHELGRALRNLQRELPVEGLKLHGWSEELSALDGAREKAAAIAALPEGWLSLRERLGAAADPIREQIPVATHRDLHDEQFLLLGERLVLLDYDLFCASSPWLDAANFLAHLELRAMQGLRGATSASVAACEEAFLAGFARPLSEQERHELRLLRAATFLRLAFVYAVRPRWRNLPPLLLEHAGKYLDSCSTAHS